MSGQSTAPQPGIAEARSNCDLTAPADEIRPCRTIGTRWRAHNAARRAMRKRSHPVARPGCESRSAGDQCVGRSRSGTSNVVFGAGRLHPPEVAEVSRGQDRDAVGTGDCGRRSTGEATASVAQRRACSISSSPGKRPSPPDSTAGLHGAMVSAHDVALLLPPAATSDMPIDGAPAPLAKGQ